MTDAQGNDDVVLKLTLHEDNKVEIWQREGRSGIELARILRQIADGFEQGDVRRIR
jgi:hypothetical protein